jgi:hypothetical protein
MQSLKSPSLAFSTNAKNEQEVPRILFLQPQLCIRTLKYAQALKCYLGNRVSLCFGHVGHPLDSIYGYGDEYFERMIKLDLEEVDHEIKSLIGDFAPMLIHSHNAPNTLTLSAIDVAEDVPVIHDVARATHKTERLNKDFK